MLIINKKKRQSNRMLNTNFIFASVLNSIAKASCEKNLTTGLKWPEVLLVHPN